MTGFRDRRLHGKDCSYNPFAFPPSLEVRCRRYDPMASIVPTMLLHFLRPWKADGGGTTPWMEEVERSRKPEPRAKQEPEPRATQGAVAEERARLHGKDCSYNPVAFPPSLEVRCRRYDPRASIVPTMLLHFLRPWKADGGGTTPGMEEVERSRRPEPRAKQEPEPRAMQEQLPTTAGMQEVEQCRSNCRRLQGCRR